MAFPSVKQTVPVLLESHLHHTDAALPVMLQALGIALKLTAEGDNQFVHPQLYFCIVVRAQVGPLSCAFMHFCDPGDCMAAGGCCCSCHTDELPQ